MVRHFEYNPNPSEDLELDDDQKHFLISWLEDSNDISQANYLKSYLNGDWYIDKDFIPGSNSSHALFFEDDSGFMDYMELGSDLVDEIIHYNDYVIMGEEIDTSKKLNESVTIWSSNGTRNYLDDIEDEDLLRDELKELGYSETSLNDKSLEELKQLIIDDEYLNNEIDVDDFYDNIEPMIQAQTNNNMIIMAGIVGRWDNAVNGGKVIEVHELIDGDWDVDNISIIEDEYDHLVWIGEHNDGKHRMHLYAIPSEHDKLVTFVTELGLDKVEQDWYGYEAEEAIELAIEDLSTTFLNDAITDWFKIKDVCKPIVDNSNKYVTMGE